MRRLFLSTLICIQILTALNPVMATSCYNCPKGTNRKWKSINCVGDLSDCGDCLEGFQLTEDGQCKRSEIDIKENGSVFILPNSTVNFDCFFNEPVDCAWHRRGFHVLIGGRYTFKDDGHNGLNTKDCSITIRSFKDIDIGQWDCKSMANSYHRSISSANAYLHMLKENTVIVRNKESASVPFEESVILPCYNDGDGECAWQRRNAALQIDGRYSYFAKHSGTADIRDYSILIRNFQQIDVGEWKCDIMTDSTAPGKIKTIVELSLVSSVKPAAVNQSQAQDSNGHGESKVKLIERPSSAKVLHLGGSVVLTCRFNVEVGCSWQKEGKEVEIVNNYSYINGKSEDTVDCSIRISPVCGGDVGKWTCSNKGASPEETITSNVAELVMPPMVPPSPPEITVINPALIHNDAHGRTKRSLNNRGDDEIRYTCSSKNGFPAPTLYWQFENGSILTPKPNITTNQDGTGVLYSTTISIQFLELSDQIAVGATVLRCIAEHPAFDKAQMTVYTIEGYPVDYFQTPRWPIVIGVAVALILSVALITILIYCLSSIITDRGWPSCKCHTSTFSPNAAEKKSSDRDGAVARGFKRISSFRLSANDKQKIEGPGDASQSLMHSVNLV